MSGRRRYRLARSRPPDAWKSRRAVEEDDDDHHHHHQQQPLLSSGQLESNSRTTTLRKSSTSIPSLMAQPKLGNMSPSAVVSEPTVFPSVPSQVPSGTRDSSQGCAQKARIEVSSKHQPVQSAPAGLGVCSGPKTDARKAGQPAVHEGRLGRWILVSDAPLPGPKYWAFYPLIIPKRKACKARDKRNKRSNINFSSLPGELRIQIYQLVIPQCRVLIESTRPNKELDKKKQIWSEQDIDHKRTRSRLFHTVDDKNVEQDLTIAQSLLRVCKQVRNDLEVFLYARTFFCFASIRTLQKFLSTVSTPGLRSIQKLQILHKGYGNPEMLENRRFRDKYYRRWASVCESIGQKLAGLKHLKLQAMMYDWPCDFTNHLPQSAFWRACLEMAPKWVEKVEVALYHDMIGRNKVILKELARRLENEMIAKESQQQRDSQEISRPLKPIANKQVPSQPRARA